MTEAAEGEFGFEHQAGTVRVTYPKADAHWRFTLEDGTSGRLLKPVKTSQSKAQQRELMLVRRNAYAFAVSEARRLNLID